VLEASTLPAVMVVKVKRQRRRQFESIPEPPTPTCHFRPPSAYGVHMKPPKVVPITADEHRLIAIDQKSHR
jgi:hypothetical protein